LTSHAQIKKSQTEKNSNLEAIQEWAKAERKAAALLIQKP
jgi:hypothetical protein